MVLPVQIIGIDVRAVDVIQLISFKMALGRQGHIRALDRDQVIAQLCNAAVAGTESYPAPTFVINYSTRVERYVTVTQTGCLRIHQTLLQR